MPAAIVTKAEKLYDEIAGCLKNTDGKPYVYRLPDLEEYDHFIVPTLMLMFEQEGWSVRYHSPSDLHESDCLTFTKYVEKSVKSPKEEDVPWAD